MKSTTKDEDVINLSKEQSKEQIKLCLEALPMPRDFNIKACSEFIAHHLAWISKEI